MANAPETLWVDPSSMDDLNMYVGHDSRTMDYLNMDVEYTRADISQARIAELESQLDSALTLIDVSYSHEMKVEELLLKSKET
jgi:hypothetical protein